VRMKKHVVQMSGLVETVLNAAAIGQQNVSVIIKHLVFKKLRASHFVVVLNYLSFLHDYASLHVAVDVHLKRFVLQVLYHCNVCLLKVADA